MEAHRWGYMYELMYPYTLTCVIGGSHTRARVRQSRKRKARALWLMSLLRALSGPILRIGERGKAHAVAVVSPLRGLLSGWILT